MLMRSRSSRQILILARTPESDVTPGRNMKEAFFLAASQTFAGVCVHCVLLAVRSVSDLVLFPPVTDFLAQSILAMMSRVLIPVFGLISQNRKSVGSSCVFYIMASLDMSQCLRWLALCTVAIGPMMHANSLLWRPLPEAETHSFLTPLIYLVSVCSTERHGIHFGTHKSAGLKSPSCHIVRWALRLASWYCLIAFMSRKVMPPLSRILFSSTLPTACFAWRGSRLLCDELQLAREFNSQIMPTMAGASYNAVRHAATRYGLEGWAWNIGHACPDPDKESRSDQEDFGWNLFAHHASDNQRLGHCLVSCAEARHFGAFHVNCHTAPSKAACVKHC